MTDNTQPEALRLAGFLDKLDVRTVDRIQNCVSAAAELRRQHARIVELESQLAAIGAGGVSPLMGAAGDAAVPAKAAPTEDVRQKIGSNTWDHFGDILPTLKAISHGDWYWGANTRCKYIEIRLDTRDGGCILYDRERVRISPEQFAHQAGGGCGKMEPWPATNAIPPSSAKWVAL